MTITGDADIYASATIGAVLEKLADGLPIAVDLRKCNYIDSAMVSKLIAMRKRTRSQIRLVVDHRSVVARVIDLTQIATIMPVVATVEEAKAQLMP